MEEETDDDLSVAARYAEGISYNVNAIVSTGATVRAFPMDSESSSSESDGEPENAVAGDGTAEETQRAACRPPASDAARRRPESGKS